MTDTLDPEAARGHLRDALNEAQKTIQFWLHHWEDLDAYHLHSPNPDHVGGPVETLDGIVTRKLHDECRARFGSRIHFLGEESSTTAAIAPGDLGLQDDAVDGTLPAVSLGIGFASTGVLYLHLGHGVWTLISAGVATPNSTVTWVEKPGRPVGRIYSMDPSTSDETRIDAVRKGRSDVVSVVAATPEDRDTAEPLLKDSSLTVFTLGGSPMLFPLLTAKLGAVVALKWQRPWDALALLAIDAEDAPATVVTSDGAVDRDTVFGWFLASMSTNRADSVPPHATVTNPDAIEPLVALLRKARIPPH